VLIRLIRVQKSLIAFNFLISVIIACLKVIVMSSLFERLKNFRLVRKIVYAFVGLFSYPGLAIINKLKISGTEHLKKLPRENVLFVSNHQTYFADVITFLHIFCAVKWGKMNRLGIP